MAIATQSNAVVDEIKQFSNDFRNNVFISVGLLVGILLFAFVFTVLTSGNDFIAALFQGEIADGETLGSMFSSTLNITEKDLGDFGIIVVSGLVQGMLLFLVASGLSIVFGLMDVLNLAQGAFFTVGAYVTWQVHHADVMSAVPPDLRFVFALVAATVVGGILGIILERGLLQPLYSRPIFQIVLTFGVAIVIGEILKAIWGTAPKQWLDPITLTTQLFFVFGQQFNQYRLFVIVMGLVLIFAIAFLLQRTRLGIIVRAGVEDSEMVEALGIDVRLVFTGVFVLGSAAAAFGGGVAAPFLGAGLGLGQGYLLGAIAVVVLGGLGSYEGTAIASLIVGFALSTMQDVSLYVNQGVWASLTPMILLALVLLLRPAGLFGKER